MERCPLCGAALVCRDSALSHWCVSPECGAFFQDLHLEGAVRYLARLDEEQSPVRSSVSHKSPTSTTSTGGA